MPRNAQRDEQYLADIFDAAEHIARSIEGVHEAALDDRSFYNNVVRELEIIGEASRGLSTEFRAAHPDIAWAAISRMRNILVHVYWDIQREIVWEALTSDVPELVRLLRLHKTRNDILQSPSETDVGDPQ